MSTFLLPASPQTVFTYEVKNSSLVWTSVPQPFKENLLNIDEIMPALLAEILLLCYRNKGGCSTHELCEQITVADPLHLDTRYRLKVMRFLEALALGMNPQQPWDGNIDIPPHFTIGNPTATAVTFHPNERRQLREYLYHHTYFESPSLARNNREQPKASTPPRSLLHLPLQIRYSYAHGLCPSTLAPPCHANLSRRSICVDGSISGGRNSNKARDQRIRASLESQGWRVLTLWECEIKTILQTGIIPNLTPQDEEIEPCLMAAEGRISVNR